MKLNELSPSPGSVREGKRKGRGPGSGLGKTGGRGHKGQKARSGGGVRPGFEGGQMPMTRQLPKRGFINHFAVVYAPVNLSRLDVFEDGAVVDLDALREKGIVNSAPQGIKILAHGDLTKKLTVRANAFSASAREKIEAAGLKAEEV